MIILQYTHVLNHCVVHPTLIYVKKHRMARCKELGKTEGTLDIGDCFQFSFSHPVQLHATTKSFRAPENCFEIVW